MRADREVQLLRIAEVRMMARRARDILPPDRIGSQNSSRPSATFSGVVGLSAGPTTSNGRLAMTDWVRAEVGCREKGDGDGQEGERPRHWLLIIDYW